MRTHTAERGSTRVSVLLGLALLAGVVLGGYVIAGSISGSATPHPADEPGFIVELTEDGDATVVVTYTFDLDNDARAQAFEELRDSETEREEFRQRFESRMQDVAVAASVATDREMSLSDAEIAIERVEETGIVRLSVTWSGLAGGSDDSLVVTEPFASGFTPDRPVSVVLPDSYEVTTATPAPAEQAAGQLTWATGTDLDGFELVVSPEASDEDDEAVDSEGDNGADEAADGTLADEDDGGVDDSGPGFGFVGAVVGLLATLLTLSRR